jgi:hypothetical protein
MPRASRSRKSSPTAAESQVQPTPVVEQDPYLSPIGRDAKGHFARGNAGGPGNPHARHCARMLTMFRTLIDEDKLAALILMLYQKALSGDVGATKLVLSYTVGKPGAAPEPDGIERNEWNRFQETALRHEEVKDLLTTLPSNVANEIVRGTWPIAAGAFADSLGHQLQQGMAGSTQPATTDSSAPSARETQQSPLPAPVEAPGIDRNDLPKQPQVRKGVANDKGITPPLPNGKTKCEPGNLSGTEKPIAAAQRVPVSTSKSTPPVGPSTADSNDNRPAPIPNRKAARSQLQKKPRRRWVAKVAEQMHL